MAHILTYLAPLVLVSFASSSENPSAPRESAIFEYRGQNLTLYYMEGELSKKFCVEPYAELLSGTAGLVADGEEGTTEIIFDVAHWSDELRLVKWMANKVINESTM